ncbi:hypothetical protein G7046_g3798 [Stylonectria norvegica]|nr:hypothetical protein G7046_g3798 [Stylonectria norvegica]
MTLYTSPSAEFQQSSLYKSSYPVFFPEHEALTKPQAKFESFVRDELSRRNEAIADEPVDVSGADQAMSETAESETFTLVTETTTAEITKNLLGMDVDPPEPSSKPAESDTKKPDTSAFMKGLLEFGQETEEPPNLENMMRTENNDLAYRSTNDSLVDLFTELEDVVTGPRLNELLQSAWVVDPLITLKIIFNARSIHLGKGSKNTFYRCAGWLAKNHPLTLVSNLQWLSRPVIEKKVVKKETEDDIVLVDSKEEDEDDPSRFDVRHGVAHGYWKDLLNILALAANNKLDVLSDPRDVLNVENPGIIKGKSFNRLKGDAYTSFINARAASKRDEREKQGGSKSARSAAELRHQTRDERHEAAIKQFNFNPVYRALHLTIARLFAEQLSKDIAALGGDDRKAKGAISLCAKWAPSQARFHDKHTFIVSSIADIIYHVDRWDKDIVEDLAKPAAKEARRIHLLVAREEYRKDISALRKHLEIVERDISAKTIENIKYERVPSLAMNNYSKIFIQKDLDRFEEYIDRVAQGKSKISGATLMPSTLIKNVQSSGFASEMTTEEKANLSPSQLVDAKMRIIQGMVCDGQWNTLVQRIKDSGTLESSIAVCDVSGSMTYPTFPDKTCPMDTAIGLSLLVAEVTKPPFGGAFITFSESPTVEEVKLESTVHEKYEKLSNAEWGQTTDFVAVFEELILPMAIKNKVTKEDMVKRVFVFSDMQFDQAHSPGWNSDDIVHKRKEGGWNTSFQRIQKKYEEAGYEMPELVFWNLAGGRNGDGAGDPTAPKPVTATQEGTCLVSGYSQGMLKAFLDNGSFEEEEEEDDGEDEVVVTKDGEDEVTMEEPKKKKAKIDPITMVKKVVGHRAYSMLKAVD